MSEQADRTIPKTRLDVAWEIRSKIEKVTEVCKSILSEGWDEVFGPGMKECIDRPWAVAILDGMIKGTITVGDPRLADELWRLEKVEYVDINQAWPKYKELMAGRLDDSDLEVHLEKLLKAKTALFDVTRDAIEAGLTTPGQDLSAGQSKGWAAEASRSDGRGGFLGERG